MNTSDFNKKLLRDAVFKAVAFAGQPVGYHEIIREAKQFPPETTMRWLRDETIRREAGIVKHGKGQYTVKRLQRIGTINRYI